MASGGSRQRKTRWDDSRARERDDPPVPAPPPPPPPEPGGGDNPSSSTDSGREQSEVRGETEPHSQQEETRAPVEQHIQGSTPSGQWGQQMDTKPPQELWGSRGQNMASQEPWGPQGENRAPQQPWIPVATEPWVAPGVGRGVVEPWIPPVVGKAGSEPWITPGESRGATETWAPPAVNSGATEPWAPPGASRGAAETWVQPAVGRGAAEHWVPPGVGRGVSEPWVPPGVGRGATEPWVPPTVGRGTAEPWLPPGVGRGSGEPWQPPGANRIPTEPWVPPGDGRGAAGHWAPPGLGIGGAEPWPLRGAGRGAVEPWVSPGTGRGVTEHWVPPGVGRGTGEPWVPPGIGRGSAEPWVPPGVGRGSAETWAPPGMGRGSAEPWAPTGAGRGATMPSGQQPDSSGPGQPGLGGLSQESWGQHAENRAFQEQQTWGSQEPWGQQGQNMVSQEQQGWTPQESWRQQDDGRWRASQEQWGQHGQDRPSRESRGQERHGRGRGPREPWGQQWDGRDQGSQKPWKQHGDSRERGSSVPWGNQGEGRGRGAREQWGHQGEGRERGSHTPRRNQGEGRGRGSRGPWGHQGEGRGRGTRMPWAQQGQNRGSQEPWRQFEEGRGRGSQKPWGHQGDGRDRRAHEPWGQQWDGSERGSHDVWGQQEFSKDRGLQEPWNQQDNDRDRVSTDHWGQQGEDSKRSTEIWGQQAEGRERELGEPWGQQQAEVREGVLREPWGQQDRADDTGLHESIRHPGEGDRERVSQGETTEGASKEPILQQADGGVRSEGHIWQKAENRVMSSEESMGQHGLLHEPVGLQTGMQELVGSQVESIEKSLEGPLRHKGDNTDRWLEEHMLKQEDVRQLGGSHESVGKHVGMALELQEAVAQQGADKETPRKSLAQLGESGEKVPAEHVVQHDGRNEGSEELMGQPDESRERGPVASVEPYDERRSEKPVYQLGDSRERVPEDAAKQHNESIEERSEHSTISEDVSREGLSKELAGYREDTEKGSEEQMGQHEKNREFILESIGQAGSDTERGSEEPLRYHEESRDKVLEVATDQHGRDKYESSDESMRRHEESGEMTPEETMGQHESGRDKGPESPVGHHEESKVCDSEEDTVSQRPIEELMEQYEEDQRRALRKPMQHNKEGREGELQESVGRYKEAGEKVSPEPVGQHGHHVDGVLQEFVGQQEEVTEMMAQGPVKLHIEGVKLLQEAHGQHQSRDGGALSHQEEVGQRDNKQKIMQRGEFVEVAPYIKENMEAEENVSGEEALQWRKRLQEPAGTSEEKVRSSKESREHQDCREIDIKELKAESGSAVSEINNEIIGHEHIEPQKDSTHRSSEEGTILEENLCDTDIKTMTAKKEIEFGASAGIKQPWQRLPDEDQGAQEERKHSSREMEKTFTEEEVCGRVLKAEIKKEEEAYDAQSEMRHKRQKAYEDDRLDIREKKQSRRETEKSFVDKADDGGNVKEMAVEDPDEYDARADMKQRQRMYEEDKEDYEERKHRGREKKRTFEEDEVGGSRVKLWDYGKTEEEGGKRQMGHWTGRKVDEKKELEGEDGRKATEVKHWSSRKKERKREEREDCGRERKHRGRERRDKQEDEAGGERKYGSSRKKRRREKSWDEEEEEEAECHDAGGERKHRSRERRREKQQAGGEGDVQHWAECLGENEDLDREQWGFSQEMETHDEGADIAEEMIYWSGQGREQHNESVGEVEWRHERSRKERKREQHEQETGSERKHWESRERHRRREEAEDDEGCGAEEPKSSRKKEKRREHDNGGERKHRSSRKKQKRREEEELRGGGLKQWSDSEKERGKDCLGAWEMEDGGENKPRSDGQQRRVLEEDGEDTEIKPGSCRQVAKKKEEEDEVEKFLSVMEMERSRKKSETQHHNTERSQGSGVEKERKPERSVKEHGEKKYDASREKDGTKEDNTECKYIYMEVDGDKMQADDSGEGIICTPVEKEGMKEKAEVSGDVGRLSLHSRDRRRETFSAEGMLTEVGPKAGSEGRKKEAEMYSEGEEKHTLDFVARIREPEVHVRAEMKHGPWQDEKKELEVGCGGEAKHVPLMERDRQLEGYGKEVEHLFGKGERKRAHREDEQEKPGFGMDEWKRVPLEVGGEVKHASVVEMERESRQSDGGSLARSTTDIGKERKREKSVESAERIKEPLSTLPFDDGGERLDEEREIMRDLLLASATLEEEGGGNQERNMEQQMSCLSSTEDGSIREQRRELLRCWVPSKDNVGGNQEIKGELLLSLPISKEDGAGSGSKEKEKIEQLSQTPAKRGRVRKKDLLSSPSSKEENTGGEGNEKEEELTSLPSSKEADREERWVGPLPTEASQTKKRKVLEFERVYLDNLPSAAMYERSYMHRDVITHVACTKTDFIITASHDGHVKFWKKIAEGIEFVKHFRSHLGVIECIAVSSEGALFCSIGEDQAMKVFDVVNFDMINMLKLGYHPGQCEWLFCPGDAISAVASSEKSTGKIFIYDGRGSNKPMYVFERLHSSPLTHIRLNSIYKVVVSADKTGMIEYWTGPPQEYKFPKNVHWEYKTDTDLYEFAKCKAYLTSMCFSPDGKKLATIGSDRKVRIFRFLTGKLMRVFDESLSMFTELQQMRQQLPDMEFGRRMAVERELEKVDAIRLINIIFDETGHFVLYGTMLGIKVINVETNRCVRILGKQENVRILQIAMFQGVARKHRAAATVEMKASDNPVLMSVQADPTIVCTAFKKNRFYLFSKREPEDTKSADSDRDVFNEKPSKEEVMAATQAEGPKRVSDSAIVHTSMGDVHVKLFPVECPKTVENFCVHSRNGYYNGHTFHRIIKGFMVQTGDPSGTGMGGESIWGGEFEDEFHPTLRHDRPYTLSMANAGPNSNGSQFFLTVVPTPWLDNKHTVFGRVTKGMEVVQRISNVKVNPKTDKPYEDISIISITVK